MPCEPNEKSVDKLEDAVYRKYPDPTEGDKIMTTSGGVPVSTDQFTQKQGQCGPALLEDIFHLDKMQHFDRERIPERVVHARGTGAHGYFECTKEATDITRAILFSKKGKRTPVFVRFSTAVGFRGSIDVPRDVRGFSIKHYTEEGNWDMVGNNIPVFFVQDSTKFVDVIHSLKPEPRDEMPQASSAHDSFYDFASLTPEIAHMILWLNSDRALPRSLENIEGHGVHTFVFVNDKNESCYVKFVYKPVKGVHSCVWSEAQELNGINPDSARKELYDIIDRGDTLEWNVYVQVIPYITREDMCKKFGFDLNDSTKLIPEEVVELRELGKLVLNRNTDNYFSETEQSAFHPANVIPGIDFSNDPLLHGRIFSYSDTQTYRVGANRNQLPINAPKCPVLYNLQDGSNQLYIKKQITNYFPNSRDKNAPVPTDETMEANWEHAENKKSITQGCPFKRGFTTFPGDKNFTLSSINTSEKIRGKPPTFYDHFSQATMFYNSLVDWEKSHIISAFTFELSSVKDKSIRERFVNRILANIDDTLAKIVSERIGIEYKPEILNINDDHPIKKYNLRPPIDKAPSLSMDNQPYTHEGRKCLIICCDNVNKDNLIFIKDSLKKHKVITHVAAATAKPVKTTDNSTVDVDFPILNVHAAMYDFGIFMASEYSPDIVHEVQKQICAFYRHGKALADFSSKDGNGPFPSTILQSVRIIPKIDDGVIGDIEDFNEAFDHFLKSIKQCHRFFYRQSETIPLPSNNNDK